LGPTGMPVGAAMLVGAMPGIPMPGIAMPVRSIIIVFVMSKLPSVRAPARPSFGHAPARVPEIITGKFPIATTLWLLAVLTALESREFYGVWVGEGS
jgi:hypothetical protein